MIDARHYSPLKDAKLTFHETQGTRTVFSHELAERLHLMRNHQDSDEQDDGLSALRTRRCAARPDTTMFIRLTQAVSALLGIVVFPWETSAFDHMKKE